jgi:hypothetical protein
MKDRHGEPNFADLDEQTIDVLRGERAKPNYLNKGGGDAVPKAGRLE